MSEYTLAVTVKCSERECGECRFANGAFANRWCILHHTDDDLSTSLEMIFSRPQRCAACLRAERKVNEARS
jgi:hypothetical protein